jgi:hypothetical protein
MNIIAIGLAILAGSWTHVQREESWVPDSATMKVVKADLETAAERAAAERHLDLPEWSSYRFQFQGRLVDGKRIVFVNAYCWLAEDQSEDEFILVEDGGTCFFETNYDLESKSFGRIAFHGRA